MRNSRNLVLNEDIVIVGRRMANVRPHLDIQMPPSGLTGVLATGTKCEHGVYIPATSPWPDHAPDCSNLS
jgi:hypothetical protein